MEKKKLYKSFITKSKIDKDLNYEKSKFKLMDYYKKNDKDNFSLNYFYSDKKINQEDSNFEISIINMKEIYKGLLKKNNKQIRMNFLRKLDICNKNKENKPEKSKIQNIIILDWDDTLLCTSFLVSKNFYNDTNVNFSNEDKEKIKLLDQLIVELLEKSIKSGNLYIITNAKEG